MTLCGEFFLCFFLGSALDELELRIGCSHSGELEIAIPFLVLGTLSNLCDIVLVGVYTLLIETTKVNKTNSVKLSIFSGDGAAALKVIGTVVRWEFALA